MDREDACIFCRVVSREVPSRIVYEDDRILVFEDVKPQAPVHLLVIPKKHIPSIYDIREDDKDLICLLFLTINKMAKERGVSDKGYRVVTNCGPAGGQSVYHLHFHLMGGRFMRWPPG